MLRNRMVQKITAFNAWAGKREDLRARIRAIECDPKFCPENKDLASQVDALTRELAFAEEKAAWVWEEVRELRDEYLKESERPRQMNFIFGKNDCKGKVIGWSEANA